MNEPTPASKFRAWPWIGIVLLFVTNLSIVHLAAFRHLYPGQWRGAAGWMPIDLWAVPALIVIFVVAVWLFQAKNFLIPLVALFISIFSPCFLPFRPNPEFRAGIERASYLEAARSGTPFGDQHDEEIDGRNLIYWRWMAWGIDNAIGVIYDPQDRFFHGDYNDMDRESPEFMAFRKASGGHLATSKRLGDGLYLVTHT